MIQVTHEIAIDESEIEESFIRSPGPGGQNVNKVSTAVQLRFDAAGSTNLPEDVRRRLIRAAGRRLSSEGVILIESHRYRSREMNRQDAQNRLVELIRKAARPPKARRPSRPTRASQLRRLETKRRRGEVKRQRRTSVDAE